MTITQGKPGKASQPSWVMLLTCMLLHSHLAREILVLKTIK